MDTSPADFVVPEMSDATTNVSPVVEGREVCPRCGQTLHPQKCKLLCQCGYFMSCAEF